MRPHDVLCPAAVNRGDCECKWIRLGRTDERVLMNVEMEMT